MYRIKAILNNVQVQAIEYEDLQDGLAKMAVLYPNHTYSHDDLIAERAAAAQFIVDRLAVEAAKTLEQKQLEANERARLSLIQKGQQVLAFVIALNEKKYAAAELTLAQLVEMESYAPILTIERQLMRGTLPTAKYSLQNYSGLYYNQADINSIIAKIDSILGV